MAKNDGDIDWKLRLIDEVTAPAKGIVKTIKEIGDASKAAGDGSASSAQRWSAGGSAALKTLGMVAQVAQYVGETINQVGVAIEQGAQAQVGAYARAFQTGDVLGSFADFGFQLKSQMEGYIPIFGGMMQAATATDQSIVSLGLNVGSWALKLADQKNIVMNTLQGLEGSEEKASALYDRLRALSDKTPFKAADIVKYAATFRTSGFSEDKAEETIKGMADVAARTGTGTEGMGRMQMVIQRMMATGRLGGEELQQLSEVGASVGIGRLQIAKEIMARHQVTNDEAMKMMQNGKVKADEGLSIIMGLIKSNVDAGGELGSTALKMGTKTISGAWSTLMSRVEGLFEDVKTDTFTTIMADLAGSLTKGTATYEQLREVILHTFEDFGNQLVMFLRDPKKLQALIDQGIQYAQKFGSAIQSAMDAAIAGAELIKRIRSWMDYFTAGLFSDLTKTAEVDMTGQRKENAAQEMPYVGPDGVTYAGSNAQITAQQQQDTFDATMRAFSLMPALTHPVQDNRVLTVNVNGADKGVAKEVQDVIAREQFRATIQLGAVRQ